MYEERVIRPKNQLKLGLGNSGLQHTSEMNYVSSGGRSVEYPVLRHGVVTLEILHDTECRNTEGDDTMTLSYI